MPTVGKPSGAQQSRNIVPSWDLALSDAALKHDKSGGAKLNIAKVDSSTVIPVNADAAKLTGLLDDFRAAILDATEVKPGGRVAVDVDKVNAAMKELTAQAQEHRPGQDIGALGDQGGITVFNISHALANPPTGEPGIPEGDKLAFVAGSATLKTAEDVANLYSKVVDQQLPAMVSFLQRRGVSVSNVEQTGVDPSLMLKPEDLADQLRCPGMAMLVKDGLTVSKEGEVKWKDVIGQMQNTFGYSKTFATFLISVFGSTTGTTGNPIKAVGDNLKKGGFNVWDLANENNIGQHTKSLPFRQEDGTIDEKVMKEALDKHVGDGPVTLAAVASMIDEYKQAGTVAGQDKQDVGLVKRAMGAAIGETQTGGEVMLLFAAFADKGGKTMPRDRFESVFRGEIPADFARSNDGHQIGTLRNWLLRTVQTTGHLVLDDVKDAWRGLFNAGDTTASGAALALNERMPGEDGGQNALESLGKTLNCPVCQGGDDMTTRNGDEALDIAAHQSFMQPDADQAASVQS